MRIDVVVNPHAAAFRSRPKLLTELQSVCLPWAWLHAPGSLPELRQVCESLVQARSDLVIVCGGDGSYMATASALRAAFGTAALPALSLAPGGSSCTVARNWGKLLSDPAQHVRHLLARVQGDWKRQLVRRPSLSVRDDSGTERTGFILGAGLVSSFFRAFYQVGGGGYRQAAPLIAQVFLGSLVGGSLARQVLCPIDCELSIDKAPFAARSLTLLVCSVVRNLGLRLLVTHRAAEDPKRPHLVASRLSPLGCGLQYHRVLLGKPLVGPESVDQLVEGFSLRFSQPDSGYVLDGDLLTSREVHVQAGPELRVLSL